MILEASGEVDANLVDLSVKESVLQFNPQGKVDLKEKSHPRLPASTLGWLSTQVSARGYRASL